MRAATNTGAAVQGGSFKIWNSPIPYLFGGVALLLGLIAVALVILACSRKASSNPEEKPAATPLPVLQPEMEPKIFVIMAGDANPTYLAKPTASSTTLSAYVR
ncbi:protein GLUTAMINE DUMPER 5-like [Diospyros lotus]|uniref:protein GLUTAMINE DUMPER 5-like n=1 Tax=Diospyros lotus TaxID=55363 RepID=UPI0022520EA3|nr:protein GLUTAMINE DUMPER 5-like [Diospyros lotus]